MIDKRLHPKGAAFFNVREEGRKEKAIKGKSKKLKINTNQRVKETTGRKKKFSTILLMTFTLLFKNFRSLSYYIKI